jgi:aspartate/methionine/tyrosine aminotransferase
LSRFQNKQLTNVFGVSSMMPDRSLTLIERRGLRQSVNLADGHARQTLSEQARRSLRQCCDELIERGTLDVLRAEYHFLDALSARLMTKYPDNQSFILYSASISVDLAAKLLRRRNLSVHLMTPTFDNLAALITMNGVAISSVPEYRICPDVDFSYLDQLKIESLLVVLPNNPTGARMSGAEIGRLFDWAANRHVLLILDMSFRFLIPEYSMDLLAEAESRGASALVIDDTGKVLSLLDSKMSVVTCTSDLIRDVEGVHEEILLNTSAFEMELLARFLDPDGVCGAELTRVRQLVRTNRQVIQESLRACGVQPVMAADDEMSVEWVRFGPAAGGIVRDCADRGLQILPGKLFFWDDVSQNDGQEFARIALMRDTDQIVTACEILRPVLLDRKSGAAVVKAAQNC